MIAGYLAVKVIEAESLNSKAQRPLVKVGDFHIVMKIDLKMRRSARLLI
jgi:hypothetical protein